MQENNLVSTPVSPEIVPHVLPEQPKQNNFLVILLSVLLSLSVLIAGFFAYQTQKLVKELQTINTEKEVVATVKPTYEPGLQPEPVPSDPTANWKIYTDSKFNYLFKFPNTWTDQTSISDKNLGNFSLKSNEEEWITGTVFTGTPDLENDKKNGGSSQSIALSGEKYLLVAYVECMGPGCGVGKKHLDIFNQILSTFKLNN